MRIPPSSFEGVSMASATTVVNEFSTTQVASRPDSPTERKTKSAEDVLQMSKGSASPLDPSRVGQIPYSEVSFSELTLHLIDVAEEVASRLKSVVGTVFGAEEKPGVENIVTQYDKEMDQLIRDRISAQFPNYGFLTEESTTEEGVFTIPDAPIVVIVDPIDGTTNFKRNIGNFSVSIAAYDTEAEQVVSAVIAVPMLAELTVAERGKGVYLNGKRIHVSDKKLEKALIATGFPYDKKRIPQCANIHAGLTKEFISLRDYGSQVTHFSWVASGEKLDGQFHGELQPWDFAAGSLLIEEAGGRITDWDGEPLDMFKASTVAATNGVFHDTLIRKIREYGSPSNRVRSTPPEK